MTVIQILNIEREQDGAALSLEKLIMECTYVHVHSDMINVILIQNMLLFRTFTSNCCTNQNILGISLIIYQIHLFLFWVIMTDKLYIIIDIEMIWKN